MQEVIITYKNFQIFQTIMKHLMSLHSDVDNYGIPLEHLDVHDVIGPYSREEGSGA